MSVQKTEAILFDLDGTVIDSYKGIESAFNKAYKKVYGTENVIAIKPYIGPPIQEILAKVNGETDIARISSFVKEFKEQYDTEDYKCSELYSGMKELLERLWERNIKLYIATNKREKPTKLITRHLNIIHYFRGIYCNDSSGNNYFSKDVMVEDILKTENLRRETTVLVGDTLHDEKAAKENDISFIYADYGFGQLKEIDKTIFAPLETLKFINE